MSVRVVSCFPARTRRRRSDKEDEEPNRHAFRLCINSEDCHLLLNPDNWPKHVTISEWFFKANEPVQLNTRKTGNTVTSSPAAAAASSTRDVINIANTSSGLNSVSVVADVVVSEQASMTSNCEAMDTAKDSFIGDVDDVEDIDATILTQTLPPNQDGCD
jgi:hypothetical protein